jgi:hypothetical protein
VSRLALRGREQAGVDEVHADGDGLGIIDVEDGDGGAALGCAADKSGTVPAEMPAPFVTAGIKEADDLSGARVDTRDVRSFGAVAEKAGQGQIARDGRPAMLAGNDVIDLEGEHAVVLVKLAVFAALMGTLPNEPDKCFFHGSGTAVMFGQGAAGAGSQQVEQPADAAVALQLPLLRLGQVVVLVFHRELVHPVPVLLGEAEL